jgi:hypothetical protein
LTDVGFAPRAAGCKSTQWMSDSANATSDLPLESRNQGDIAGGPKSANSGSMLRIKQRLYSITSSARVSRQLNSTTIT